MGFTPEELGISDRSSGLTEEELGLSPSIAVEKPRRFASDIDVPSAVPTLKPPAPELPSILGVSSSQLPGAAGPDALDPVMEVISGVPIDILRGEAPISGYALGSAAAKSLPIVRSLPFSGKIGGTIGAILGNVLGDEVADLGGAAQDYFIKDKDFAYTPFDDVGKKSIAQRGAEGLSTVALDGIFTKVFGDPTKTSNRLKESAAENMAHVLGVSGKDLKSVYVDEATGRAIPEVYDDIITITRDGAFKRSGTDKGSLQGDFISKADELVADVDKKLIEAQKELSESDVVAAAQSKLKEVREWAKDKYKDPELRDAALELIDEAEAAVTPRKEVTWTDSHPYDKSVRSETRVPDEPIDLSYVNRLKRNYYSDKVSYDTTQAAQKVKNETTKQVAHALKETVETLFDATNYGKKNVSVKKINDLASAYYTVKKVIDLPAAASRTSKPPPLGYTAQNAAAMGAIGYGLSANNPIATILGSTMIAKDLAKYPGPQKAIGEAKLGLSDMFNAAGRGYEAMPGSTQSMIDNMGEAAGAYAAAQGGDVGGQTLTPVAESLGGVAKSAGNIMAPGVQKIGSAVGNIMAPGAHAEEVTPIKLPRDTKSLFTRAPNQFPPELQQNQDFKNFMVEGVDASDENRARLFANFLMNNKELASRYFDQSPERGYNAVRAEDGQYYLYDDYEKASYAQRLKNSIQDPIELAERLNDLNQSGRIRVARRRRSAPQPQNSTSEVSTVTVDAPEGDVKRQEYDY